MLRRKFMQTALSGFAALGLARVAKSPDEAEDEILHIEVDGVLDIYSDDSILPLKSKDVDSLLVSDELPEKGTAIFTKRQPADKDELLTIYATADEPIFIIDADGSFHFPPFKEQ